MVYSIAQQKSRFYLSVFFCEDENDKKWLCSLKSKFFEKPIAKAKNNLIVMLYGAL